MQVEVIDLTHEGLGVAKHNGKTIFVEGALPHETVQIEIKKSRSKYDEATCVEILKPSPSRVLPACAHAGVCGGCALQHVSADGQRELKLQRVLNLLTYSAKVTPNVVAAPLVSEPYFYRRKARIGVKYVAKKGKVVLGFRERNDFRITDCHECHVLDKRIASHWQALSLLLQDLESKAHIPQLEVACGDDAVALVVRHLQPIPEADLKQLHAFSQATQIHFYLQPGNESTIHPLNPETTPERLQFSIPEYQITIEFAPSDFVQINADINRQMISQVMEWGEISEEDRVLDLFCGLGNITLPLARRAQQVIGVEGGVQMTERALENAKRNGITNVEFFSENLHLPVNQEAQWMQFNPHKIVLDPPRSGAEEIAKHAHLFKAKRWVYVSCDPATLSRDVGILVHEHRFSLERVGIMDMFPHTHHIETMALLVRT